jgi:hypothetical protein
LISSGKLKNDQGHYKVTQIVHDEIMRRQTLITDFAIRGRVDGGASVGPQRF